MYVLVASNGPLRLLAIGQIIFQPSFIHICPVDEQLLVWVLSKAFHVANVIECSNRLRLIEPCRVVRYPLPDSSSSHKLTMDKAGVTESKSATESWSLSKAQSSGPIRHPQYYINDSMSIFLVYLLSCSTGGTNVWQLEVFGRTRGAAPLPLSRTTTVSAPSAGWPQPTLSFSSFLSFLSFISFLSTIRVFSPFPLVLFLSLNKQDGKSYTSRPDIPEHKGYEQQQLGDDRLREDHRRRPQEEAEAMLAGKAYGAPGVRRESSQR